MVLYRRTFGGTSDIRAEHITYLFQICSVGSSKTGNGTGLRQNCLSHTKYLVTTWIFIYQTHFSLINLSKDQLSKLITVNFQKHNIFLFKNLIWTILTAMK